MQGKAKLRAVATFDVGTIQVLEGDQVSAFVSTLLL
jgi:hypothetical protein